MRVSSLTAVTGLPLVAVKRSLVILCVALAGCETVPLVVSTPIDKLGDLTCNRRQIDDAKLVRELATATPCCSSLSDFDFKPLEIKPVSVSNRAGATVGLFLDSPVYDFPEGRSRFLAFSLPKTRESVLRIDGFGSWSFAEECAFFGNLKPRAVFPLVTFLDADRKVIKAGLSALPSYEPTWRGARFEFVIPANAAFAVIHTDPRTYGQVRSAGRRSGDVMVVSGLPAPVFLPGGPAVFASVSTGYFTINFVQAPAEAKPSNSAPK